MLRAFATGRLPVAELRAQIGRQPLPAPVPGVPPGWSTQLRPLRRSIGVLSTLAYLVAVRAAARARSAAQAANLIALLLTAVANTAANRRLTFGIRGGAGRRPRPAAGPGRVRPRPGADQRHRSPCLHAATAAPPRRTAEVRAARRSPTPLATLLRFVLFRGWVFRPRTRRPPSSDPAVLAMETAR